MKKQYASIPLLGITILFAAALNGCAHGKMGNIEKPLELGVITKDMPIVVEVISAKDAVVSGDKSTDAKRVAEEKAFLEGMYHKRIAEYLRLRGFTKVISSEKAATSGVVISGNVTRIAHGSGAARMWVGMGAGSSNMYGDFKIEDRTKKTVISKFEIIATSGGQGGFSALGSFMEAHIVDGAKKFAEYVETGKTK